jgi:uncharacterized protein (TIGR02118 family)
MPYKRERKASVYKLIGYWSAPKPADIDDFERYYLEHHAPLTATLPGLRKLILLRADPAPDGTEPPYYRLAELHFDSPEQFAQAAKTPEWTVIFEDGARMAERFGVVGNAGFGWAEDFPVETSCGR